METAATPTHKSSRSGLIRLGVALVLSATCLWAIWLAANTNLSRVLSGVGAAAENLDAVNQALRFAPHDPEARTIRGLLLSRHGEYADSAAEFERAAQLRPRDYHLWLQLGMAREGLGDGEGAERALRESARLAPYYAQPAWQLGNFLFRQGRRDEAFAELHRAAKTDPSFLPSIIELAGAALGNAEAIRKALQPQSAFEHLALATSFARHGKGSEAVAEFRSAGSTTREDSRALITELLAQKELSAAHQIWAQSHEQPAGASAEEILYDGGFEKPLEIKEPGFGWQVSQDNPAISLSLDSASPYQGGKSLRIEFRGASNHPGSAIAQIILVGPETRYRLQFAARTQELISGGLPIVVIGDAVAPGLMFSESQPFPSGSDQWRQYAVDFTTGKQTQAVRLQLLRRPCTTEPCPIFGMVWLDAFSLRKV